MKVILNQTVPKVGKQGQVVSVADGYARNFLFPRGLAIVAEKRQIKALELRKVKVDARLAATKAEAEQLKTQLDGKIVRIEGKVGRDTTKLFGAITAQDVADALLLQHNVTVEKKQVGVLEPIKRLGDHAIDIDLHRDVDAHITVTVFDPDAPVIVDEPESTPEIAEVADVAEAPVEA